MLAKKVAVLNTLAPTADVKARTPEADTDTSDESSVAAEDDATMATVPAHATTDPTPPPTKRARWSLTNDVEVRPLVIGAPRSVSVH